MARLLAFAVLASALCAGPATAHMVFDEEVVPAGQLVTVHLRVMHGCEGSPTRKITVRLPDGVLRVTPRVIPGWRLTTASRRLDQPIEQHGFLVESTVSSITWEGGRVPDDAYEVFEFRFQTPASGDVLRFPVTQTCVKGETRWDGVPAAGASAYDLPTPAPFIRLTPKAN